jgi:hypothetical protein
MKKERARIEAQELKMTIEEIVENVSQNKKKLT